MKLAELERHLRYHGCVLYREGGAHSIWFNPTSHKIASVPCPNPGDLPISRPIHPHRRLFRSEKRISWPVAG